jgi:hypothetical protein
MSLNMRVSERTRQTVRQLANKQGVSMQHVLDQAVEQYRREQLLEEANRAFAALRQDPQEWERELQERRDWDATLLDGIEDE